MSKYVCNPADFAGNFVREVQPTYRQQKGRKSLTPVRQVELICKHCQKHFITALSNAKRIKQECCSNACNQARKFHFGIPNEKHPLYSRWLSMTQRCNTQTHSSYSRYGGRGIFIEPYLQNFVQYVQYVMGLPNAPTKFPTKLQIDRINNDGNYERGNLRWVTQSTNMANATQQKKIHTDKYIGVNWSIRKNKYCVRLRHNKQSYFLGWFDDEFEGAKARDEFIKKHNLPNKLNNV